MHGDSCERSPSRQRGVPVSISFSKYFTQVRSNSACEEHQVLNICYVQLLAKGYESFMKAFGKKKLGNQRCQEKTNDKTSSAERFVFSKLSDCLHPIQ